MPKINLETSFYFPPVDPEGYYQWLPYKEPSAELSTLQEAIELIDSRIKNQSVCNKAFENLPLGRSFVQVWNDSSVWISYDPSISYYGATLKSHVTVSALAIRMGRWTTAATIVHELAHVNGASLFDSKAEDTLLHCLLKDMHNPNIIGDIILAKKSRGILIA